jgi:hypothetical protein
MYLSCRPSFLFFVIACGLLFHTVSSHALPSCSYGFSAQDIITKDVCIIGGGATGTYSAVRLREDMGKSVAVIERQNNLGGHTETYIDPITGIPLDYGVRAWNNVTVVTDFFARFNVSLVVATNPLMATPLYIDLRSGKTLNGYPAADPSAALAAYSAQLEEYPFLVGGYHLPNPVPKDLLLPFRDFVAKYQLEAALPILYSLVNALGDVLDEPTIYIMQRFGLAQLRDFEENRFVTTEQHDNSVIYQKAQALLGADALLSSSVVRTCRVLNGHSEVIVQTPAGRKLIRAKKLLVTIPPVLDNLGAFDLDAHEKAIFSKFYASSYYTGLVNNTGIPDGTSIVNVDSKSPLHYPRSPFVGNIDFTGVPGLHSVSYISKNTGVTAYQAKSQITRSILSMNSAGTIPTTAPNFVVLSSHTPLQIRVGAYDIARGFYNQLYDLQGRHGTFYTGAAWAADYSAILWEFTEGVLPDVAA